MSTNHTPTPWRISQNVSTHVYAPGHGIVASCGVGKAEEADAAYIVECVNNYATLQREVEELRAEAAAHNEAYASQMREIVALKERVVAMQSVVNYASICETAWNSESGDCQDEEIALEEALIAYRKTLSPKAQP
jgi:hypothetical protein